MIIKAAINRSDEHKVKISIDNGKLLVTAPNNMDESTLKNILIEHSEWYKDKVQPVKECGKVSFGDKKVFGNVQLASEMFAFKKVLIAGQIFDVVGGDVKKAILNGETVVLEEKVFGDAAKRKKAITSFLKMLAKECLRQEISQFGTSIALCPSAINVTALKTSGWIKCSDMQNKVVTIDYRAVQLPFELRNYLVAHAFSHFFQLGHDAEFFRVLSNYLPNFEMLQNKLQNYWFLKEIV